jgi:hypothetical protein
MGYQTGWTEMYHWLEKSVEYLEEKVKTSYTEVEKTRLTHKLQGVKMSLDKIRELEKQFNLCIHEDRYISREDGSYVYCSNCNRMLRETVI